MSARKNKQTDIDFEIKFYEGVLKEKGDFLQALMALGDLYTKRGCFDKGLQIDRKLHELRPEDPIVLYNLACSYSLLNDVDLSFETLKRAIQCGYDDFPHLVRDSDLNNMLKEERYRKYLTRVIKEKTDQRS